MKTNQKGIDLMHEYESCRLESYLCPAKIWTIGWGNTFYADGTPVKQGEKISQEQANRLFGVILSKFESQVYKSVKPMINSNQFSALVCFTYNVGIGNFLKSTLLKKVNLNPNDPTIRNEFMKWNKGGGVVLNGLTRRRKSEADLYFS
jgi:lysozyme